jgi:hypothetical protein
MPLRSGEERTLTVGGGSGTGAYTLAYAETSTNPAVATVTAVSAAAGTFTVKVTASSGEYALVYGRAGDDNYLAASQQSTAHDVGKADAVIVTDAQAATGLVYDGAPQDLVTPGEGSQHGMEYRLGEDGAWSAIVPAAVDAGAYDVDYKAAGDPDHNDSLERSVTASIAKAGQAAVSLSGALPETAGAAATVTVGGGSGTGLYTLISTNPQAAQVTVVNAAAGTFTVKALATAAGADYGLEYGRAGDGNYLPISVNTPSHHITAKPEDPSGGGSGDADSTDDADAPANVAAIRTALSKYSVVKGRSLTIPLVVELEEGETKAPELSWESANPGVATVTKLTETSVKIKGLKAGKTKITIRAADGERRTLTVTVSKKKVALAKLQAKKPKPSDGKTTSKKKKPSVGKITVWMPKSSLKVGQTAKLKISVSDTPPSTGTLKFSSSNKKVVTIDKAGYMTAHKKGTATITVKFGGRKVTVTVKVK